LELSPTGELGAVAALDRSRGLPPAGAEVLSSASTPPGGNRVGSYWDWARLYEGGRAGMSTGSEWAGGGCRGTDGPAPEDEVGAKISMTLGRGSLALMDVMVACSSTSSMTCWVILRLPTGFPADVAEPTTPPERLAELALAGNL